MTPKIGPDVDIFYPNGKVKAVIMFAWDSTNRTPVIVDTSEILIRKPAEPVTKEKK